MLHQIQWEQLPSSVICTYWPTNPAFDTKRVLLRLMFFINEDKTKYVSVGFYPASDYQHLVEFGAIRSGGSQSLILSDEQFVTLANCLDAIRDSICVGGELIIKCDSGNFRLHMPRRNGSARMFVGKECECFTSYSNNCAITLSLCRTCYPI